MIIQTLVEGEGETGALPILLRRFREISGAFYLDFGRPIRRHRSELVNEAPVRRAVQVALRQERGCDGLLILFDADSDCPKELAANIQAWAQAEAGRVPCEVVIANREYEAWFLGALESLRDRRDIRVDAVSSAAPESVRGAKEKLQSSMLRPYSETLDQPAGPHSPVRPRGRAPELPLVSPDGPRLRTARHSRRGGDRGLAASFLDLRPADSAPRVAAFWNVGQNKPPRRCRLPPPHPFPLFRI